MKLRKILELYSSTKNGFIDYEVVAVNSNLDLPVNENSADFYGRLAAETKKQLAPHLEKEATIIELLQDYEEERVEIKVDGFTFILAVDEAAEFINKCR